MIYSIHTELATLAGGIATTVSVCINPEFAYFSRFDPTTVTWLAGSAAADVLITVSLVWSLVGCPRLAQPEGKRMTVLLKMTRKTGVSSIDHIINRIILCQYSLWSASSVTHLPLQIFAVTVQTGMITACAATIDVTVALTVQVSIISVDPLQSKTTNIDLLEQ